MAVTVVCPPAITVSPWASDAAVSYAWGDARGAFPNVALNATLARAADGTPFVAPPTARFTWSVLSRPPASRSAVARLLQPDALSPHATFTPDAPGGYTLGLVVDDGCGRALGNLSLAASCGSGLSLVIPTSPVVIRASGGLSPPFADFGASGGLSPPFADFGAFAPLPLAPLLNGSSFPAWAAARWTIESAPTGSLAGLLGMASLNASLPWAAGAYALAPLATEVDTATGNTTMIHVLVADVPGTYLLRVRWTMMGEVGILGARVATALPFVSLLQFTVSDGCAMATKTISITATCA